MKKYGIYAGCSGSNNGVRLIQEHNTLKEAAREAFRLSRCRYHHSDIYLADIFIVCDNTATILNWKVTGEYIIRYSVEQCIFFDNVIGFLEISGGQMGTKHTFLVKAGTV